MGDALEWGRVIRHFTLKKKRIPPNASHAPEPVTARSLCFRATPLMTACSSPTRRPRMIEDTKHSASRVHPPLYHLSLGESRHSPLVPREVGSLYRQFKVLQLEGFYTFCFKRYTRFLNWHTTSRHPDCKSPEIQRRFGPASVVRYE